MVDTTSLHSAATPKQTLEIQRKCLYTLRRDVVIGDWRKRRTILQTLIQDAVRDLVCIVVSGLVVELALSGIVCG